MGRPRLIILIRHGESEGNRDKTVNQVTANHLVSLTERGHAQAHRAGHQLLGLLKPDDNILFYTSPYKRTRETADEIVKVMDAHNVPYKINEEPRMREQDFGNYQGSSEEMKQIWKSRAQYGHFFFRIPNGESAADVYDRCAGFNESLFRQFSSDKFPSVLVLVTHGIWTRVFIMKWFRWTYEQFESLRNVKHCQLITMQKNEDPDHRYHLTTHLKSWDEDDTEEFNSDDCVENMDVFDHATMESITKEGLRSMKVKEQAIREEYKKATASRASSATELARLAAVNSSKNSDNHAGASGSG